MRHRVIIEHKKVVNLIVSLCRFGITEGTFDCTDDETQQTKRSCVTIFYFYQKYFVMLVLFKIQATTPLEKFSTAVCIDVQIISCEK